MKRVALLLILGCAVVLARNVVITNPTTQPIPIRIAGAAPPVATPTGSPSGSPTPSPTATASAFNPATVAGLKGWWKADALAVVADGTGITSWTDSSTNANHAIGGAVAPGESGKNNPLYYSNQVNGLPAMRFEAGLGRLCVLTTPFVTNGGWTIFAVMKNGGGVSDICSLGNISTDAAAGPINNSDSYYLGAGTWFRSDRSADFNWHVVSGSASSITNVDLFIDGLAAPGPSGVQTTNVTFTHIGERSPGNFSTGDIAEILAYQGVLSSTDKQNVNSYLVAKYALQPTLPWTVPGLTFWIDASQITASGGTLKRLIEADLIKPMPAGKKPAGKKAEVTPLLADGTVLSGWADKGGHNNLFGSGTYKTAIINARPIVRFNGTSESMSSTTGSIANYSGPLTTIAVAKLPAGSWITAWVGGGNYMGLMPSGHLQLFCNGPGGGAVESASDYSGVWHVFTGVYGGNGNTFGPLTGYVDGTQVGSDSTGSKTTIVGIMTDGSGKYPGDLAEVLTFKGALSDTNRQAIEAWLKAKYAIP